MVDDVKHAPRFPLDDAAVTAAADVLALAGLSALRRRGPIDLVYLALAAVALCLAPIATVLPRDALRNTAILLALVPFVVAVEYSPSWSR